ncbi:Amidohydro-3 domain-containing protein [Mycena venus]|uniref:Amidohydro-3 domain-containing protein n=1 Tax=Mycena venus TaxID=2733690 RepID=A0A8H6YID9_9AGAR|nr:Amidohydro-3 domain-containing protein [Mycena venus]
MNLLFRQRFSLPRTESRTESASSRARSKRHHKINRSIEISFHLNVFLRIRFTVALASGFTSVNDAGLDPASLDFFFRPTGSGTIPIRIYGMRFFGENEPYWGNVSTPVVGASNGHLTARSVKIFILVL